MEITLQEIAQVVNGELKGNPNLKIYGISTPENPKPETIVFCKSKKDYEKVKGKVKAYVVSEDIPEGDYIKVSEVKLALAKFLAHFFPEKHPVGISKNSVIGKNVHIGKNVYIGDFVVIGDNVRIEDNVKIYPFCYIGENTHIGENTVIFSGVHIYRNTIIGKNVRIHSGAVIGADGFGYYVGKEGIIKLNHIGSVVIEDNVEIGANTTIDRALIDQTIIKRNTKIGSLVVVAHNCQVGENNLIVSQVGLAGSVKTGKNVILAGQVGVADHITIGDNVKVAAKSAVTKNLEPNKTYGANLPAIEWNKWKRIYLYLLRLSELFKRFK